MMGLETQSDQAWLGVDASGRKPMLCLLRSFTAGFLVLAMLAHPATVLGKSVKTTIKFSKGQADPSVSLVFGQRVHRIVIDLPDAGLLPELVNAGAASTFRSGSGGQPKIELVPTGGFLSPGNYQVVLRGTASRAGKASVRAEYVQRSTASCDGFDLCPLSTGGGWRLLLLPIDFLFFSSLYVGMQIDE
jgi:hypothetical protein